MKDEQAVYVVYRTRVENGVGLDTAYDDVCCKVTCSCGDFLGHDSLEAILLAAILQFV